MNTNTRTLDIIAEIINEITGVPTDQVRLDSSFSQDLDVDSLSMVEVAVALEERFEIRINDDQIKNLTTVADAIAHVHAQPVPAAIQR
jgi:acyl carrier protein